MDKNEGTTRRQVDSLAQFWTFEEPEPHSSANPWQDCSAFDCYLSPCTAELGAFDPKYLQWEYP